MPLDYHIHTKMSGDAISELEEYVKIARERRLMEIGFSEHFHPADIYPLSSERVVEYVKQLQLFKKGVDFPVKIGIEVDFIPGYEGRIKRVLGSLPFDYVIGSVHFVNDWGFDDPRYISEYQKWDINELFKTYFGLVQKCAKSGLFNIIGHPDLIKKFGYKPRTDITKLLRETVKVFKESGVCVEINTSGLSAPCREIYPSKTFVKMCFDYGIPITLGSDAHAPQDVGKNFTQALKLIKEVGYESIARFTLRKLELIKV